MQNYANPTHFLRLVRVLLPVTAGLLAVGLYLALFVAPADYQQGETVRIMYLHVPSAWMAMFVYLVMTSAAIGTLVFRHPLADVAQKAAAPVGAAFRCLCLGGLFLLLFDLLNPHFVIIKFRLQVIQEILFNDVLAEPVPVAA